MAWTTPSTWTAGSVLTAAQLNTQLRDNMRVVGNAWTAYTPSWTAATTNPAIGNGTLTGRYAVASKWLRLSIRILMGSTTTYGTGAYSLTLPAGLTPVAARWTFSGVLRDASAAQVYPVCGVWNSTSSVIQPLVWPTTAGNPLASMSGASPIAMASGDELFFSGELELA